MISEGTSVGLDRIACPTEVRREEEPTTGVVVVRHEWEVSPGNGHHRTFSLSQVSGPYEIYAASAFRGDFANRALRIPLGFNALDPCSFSVVISCGACAADGVREMGAGLVRRKGGCWRAR
jgi:hypothetical protein